MRNFKLIGMALLAIVLCMNFVSCSNDDKDIDVNSLEGTWGLIQESGTEYDSKEGERIPYFIEYDLNNPTSDCSLFTFKNIGNNTYTLDVFEWWDNNWDFVCTYKGSLDKNIFNITDGIDGSFSVSPITIKEISSNRLIIQMTDRDWNGDDEFDYREWERTMTFTRME